MDWSNEPYVRLYTRNTPTWRRLRWQGQCLLMQILRNVDRAGVIDGIIDPVDDLVAMTNMPEEVVEIGYELLIKYNVIQFGNDTIFMPNFLDAQETSKSDKQRQAECRQRKRDKAKLDTSQNVTPMSQSDTQESQVVTGSHEKSQVVTLTYALPCVTDPNHTNNTPRKKSRNEYSDDFESFWEIYKIKKEKHKAYEAWKKTKRPDLKIVLKALEKQNKHKEECDRIDKFCPEFPYAERWIKKRKWEDEIVETKQQQQPAQTNAFLAAVLKGE